MAEENGIKSTKTIEISGFYYLDACNDPMILYINEKGNTKTDALSDLLTKFKDNNVKITVTAVKSGGFDG